MGYATRAAAARRAVPDAAGLRLEVAASGLISASSAAWETMLGVQASTLVGSPFLALFEDRDRERARTLHADAAAGGSPPIVEMACRRLDGSFARVCWRLRPAGGGAVTALARDVTVLRAHRAEQAAAARFAEVGVVAAVIAHDLNNILALIALTSGTLRSSPGLPAQYARDLDDLDEGVKQGAGLVREVMEH
ncbi:MAG: hypothetical protein HY079_13970, partial [Elusimicrobia bacterium]|nr:hypothetical protein [Elusimicrobiota bacterium]